MEIDDERQQTEDEEEQYNPFALKRDMRNVDWLGLEASPFRINASEE